MEIMTRNELYLECDLLKGNINRMCVTDNFEELDKMELVAIERIRRIFDYNFKRLSEKESE